MEDYAFIMIMINFCTLWIGLVYLKPVPDLASYPQEYVHSEENSNFMSGSHSIPDMDVVNPAFIETEAESQPNQELLSNPEKYSDISTFSLSDQVSGFFRSKKSKDGALKLPMKQGSEVRAGNLVETGDTKKDQEMSADEQEDCYNQQNIEPPGSPEGPRPSMRFSKPSMDVNPSQQVMLSRPLIYKEKGAKKIYDKEEEANEITSLYSDSERVSQGTREKAMNNQQKLNTLDMLDSHRVYKPVGVKAEFPIYDADIDFHPDPLQGILEEKYWLDPQEQEAVIKKYIDLANNVQPPRVDYVKRDAFRGEHVPKSVDSREGFKEIDSVEKECPCREIAACEDCSRGKWKKTNSSDRGAVLPLFGNRKLLSINYEDSFEEENENIEAKSSFDNGQNSQNGKIDLESAGNGDSFELENSELENSLSDENPGYAYIEERNEEETQANEEIQSFTSNYFGRKLLSLNEDQITRNEYDEDEDPDSLEDELSESGQAVNSALLQFEEGKGSAKRETKVIKSDLGRSLDLNNNINVDGNTLKGKRFTNPNISIILEPSTNGEYKYSLHEDLHDIQEDHVSKSNFFEPNRADEFFQMQKPFLNKPRNIARYYVPNKFGNFFQKSLKKKKPTVKTSTIDPNLEFEIESNETLRNVSIEMNDFNVSLTTEMARLVKHNKKRGGDLLFLSGKGRRSYNVPLIKLPHHKQFQGSDESAALASDNSTVRANTSSNATTNLPADTSSTTETTADTTTDTTTDSTPTAGTNDTTVSTVKRTTKKKIEEYDEDTFDAEIANDIVETVIAESQSGSVVGHNLGLCRRNDSISKYAKVAPESEKLLKMVTECILEHIRDRLEGQSCTLLETELLTFLKWMVLSGESYKDYLAREREEFKVFKSEFQESLSGGSERIHDEAASNSVNQKPTARVAKAAASYTSLPVYESNVGLDNKPV